MLGIYGVVEIDTVIYHLPSEHFSVLGWLELNVISSEPLQLNKSCSSFRGMQDN